MFWQHLRVRLLRISRLVCGKCGYHRYKFRAYCRAKWRLLCLLSFKSSNRKIGEYFTNILMHDGRANELENYELLTDPVYNNMNYIKHVRRVFHRISKCKWKVRIRFGEPKFMVIFRASVKKAPANLVESSPIFGQSSGNLKLDLKNWI